MSKENVKNEETVEEIAVKEESVAGTVEVVPSKMDKFKGGLKKFGKRIAIGFGVVTGAIIVYSLGERHGQKKAMAENSDIEVDTYEVVDDTDTTSENNVEQ